LDRGEIMARITISEAARHGYAARPTIYRHIKSGKLSIIEEGDQKLIDVVELVRVYGEPGGKKAQDGAADAQVAVLESERDRLKGDLERMEARLREAEEETRAEREKAEKERDRLLGIVENAQKQLEDQRQDVEADNQGLWSRLFGSRHGR
jgi:flagellar motility protein MotE (MotC chaperone)